VRRDRRRVAAAEAPRRGARCFPHHETVEAVAVPQPEPGREVERVARDETAVMLARLHVAAVGEIEQCGGALALWRRQLGATRVGGGGEAAPLGGRLDMTVIPLSTSEVRGG